MDARPPDDADPTEDVLDRLRRRVLWSMPTGLYVVGSRAEIDGDVQANLMTANLVVQVSTEPKLVAVAVESAARTSSLVDAGGCFAVSLLHRADRAVVRRFVKPVADVTFDDDRRPSSMGGEAVRTAVTGAPVLERAAAWLDCAVRHRLALGSHVLFVGEVVAVDGPAADGQWELLRMEDTRMNYGG
ncbi:MAG: flavin reductase family protein [Acidimicrobiales bacterium]